MNTLLVVTENYLPGGGNRYLVDMVNAVAPLFDSVVLVGNRGALFPDDIRRLTVPVTIVDFPFVTRARLNEAMRSFPTLVKWAILLGLLLLEPLFLGFNTLFFRRLVRRISPRTVVGCNGGFPGGHALLALMLASAWTKTPAVLSVVSVPMYRRLPAWPYECLTDWLVWRSTDLVIANARMVAEQLSARRGMLSEKGVVIHNGLEQMAPAGGRKGTGEEGEFVIGCVARMDRAKGVLFLLEAFDRLACRYPHLRLSLVGKGDASLELSELVGRLGLTGRVKLAGYYTGDIHALLGTFDLYVFPSLHEGFPYSILEAMRAGCPIVATRVGGIPEAIRDGSEGILVPPGSVEALEQAIEKLVINQALRRRLGDMALERFQAEFSLGAMELRLQGIFSDFLEGGLLCR